MGYFKTNHLLKLLLFLLILISEVSAQDMKYITDINLKKAFEKEGYTSGGNLDTMKISNIDTLDLSYLGIENIEGLQYFKKVTHLYLGGNKIKKLENLPPNLKKLYCINNEIEEISDLPKSLKYLLAGHNNIRIIKNLPDSLIELRIDYNLLTKLPVFNNNLWYLNYANNPIIIDSLTPPFQNVSCTEYLQNCLPIELVKWKILNATINDTVSQVIGLKIRIDSRYSWDWGRGSITTINYKNQNTKLIADTIRRFSIMHGNNSPINYTKINYSVELKDINQFVKDIYLKKGYFEFVIGDSFQSVNLKRIKDGGPHICVSDISAVLYHRLYIDFYRQSDTIKMEYTFEEDSKKIANICPDKELQDMHAIFDWVYVYKLLNLTMGDYYEVKKVFHEENLKKLIEWAK